MIPPQAGPVRPLRVPDFPVTHGPGWLVLLVIVHAGFALAGVLLFWGGLHWSWDAAAMLAFSVVVAYCLIILTWVTLTVARLLRGPRYEETRRTENLPPFEELPWSRQ